MSRRRWATVVAAVALIGSGYVAYRLLQSKPGIERAQTGATPPRFGSDPGGGPTEPPPPPKPRDKQAEVARVMAMWRQAIIDRNAEAVLECDRAFLSEPAMFSAALIDSAQSDGEERVRAFSTRVLGKLADPAQTELFRKLLGDPSRFVRENAAWALGQLGSRAAINDLERVRRQDSAENVRRSAAEALKKVQSVTKPVGKRG